MDAELRRIRNRAIVVFSILLVVVIQIVRNHLNEDETEYLLRENVAISKMEIRVTSSPEEKIVVISDRTVLDSINAALRNIKEIDVLPGGIFDIRAEINVYKKNKAINFWVQDSPYNGWMLLIGNRTFQCDYLFRFIKQYGTSK